MRAGREINLAAGSADGIGAVTKPDIPDSPAVPEESGRADIALSEKKITGDCLCCHVPTLLGFRRARPSVQ
jgi:hypothetical protein